MKYIEENELAKRYNKTTCLVCSGKGTVEFRQGISKCSRCNGTGIMTCDL